MTIEGSHGGRLVPYAVLVSATCSVFLDSSPRMCYKCFTVQNWWCQYIHVENLIIWFYSKTIYWAIDNSVFEMCKQTLQCFSRPNLCLSSSIRPTTLLKKSKKISRKGIITNASLSSKVCNIERIFSCSIGAFHVEEMRTFYFQPVLEGNSLVQLFQA